MQALASERIGRGSRRISSKRNSSSLLLNEVGDLVQKHLTEVIALQEVVSCNPRILANVVWQFQRRLIFIDLHVEHKVVVLCHKTTCNY